MGCLINKTFEKNIYQILNLRLGIRHKCNSAMWRGRGLLNLKRACKICECSFIKLFADFSPHPPKLPTSYHRHSWRYSYYFRRALLLVIPHSLTTATDILLETIVHCEVYISKNEVQLFLGCMLQH